jgi:hypothetical protein
MSDDTRSSSDEATDPTTAAAAYPTEAEPDPAPERERATAAEPETSEGADRGGTGEPVGRDNIREGRVDGLMGGPHQQQGQGQGG